MTDPQIQLPPRFRIIRKLGEGGMGAVYMAHDSQMQNEIALKVVLPERASKPEIMRRVRNEIRLLHRIGGHSNVVTLHECLELESNALVMVMELVDGEGLDTIIDRSRNATARSEAARMTVGVSEDVVVEFLDWRLALEITLAVLEGLRHIHSREIVTRDIKPANILIAREKSRSSSQPGRLIVKIADFGIAKLFGEAEFGEEAMTALTQEGASMPGTPVYNAPEQVDPRKFGAIGPWTDFYALGVTLFEMLTFSLPFTGENKTDIFIAHCIATPPLEYIDGISAPRAVREKLKAVIGRALSKNSSQRYQNAEEFKRDIVAVLSGGAVSTPAVAGGSSLLKWIYVAAAMLVVTVAAAAGLYIKNGRETTAPVGPNPQPTASPIPPPNTVPTNAPASPIANSMTESLISPTETPSPTPTLPPQPTQTEPPIPTLPPQPTVTPRPAPTRRLRPTATRTKTPGPTPWEGGPGPLPPTPPLRPPG